VFAADFAGFCEIHHRFTRVGPRVVPQRCPYVTIAVPVRLTVAELNAVYHPVAEKPVIGPARLGVGSIAQKAAIQCWGNAANNLQVTLADLFRDRGKIVLQIERLLDGLVHDVSLRVAVSV